MNNYVVGGAGQGRVLMPMPVSCWVPADKAAGYLNPREKAPINTVASDIAKTQHINGCAAAVFQLTRDGKAKNITILRELPAGYGYGQAFIAALSQATFAPPGSEDEWYYRAVSVTFMGLAPGAPGTIVPQAQPIKPPNRT